MKLGQGSHKRAPRWIWAAMLVGCAVALPSGSVGVAQDAKNLELATTAQVAESKPKADDQVAEPLRRYREDIGDLIDALVDQGKNADEARVWILEQLPLHAVTLVYPERLMRGRGRIVTPLRQISERELQFSGTVSEIDEVKTKLQFLRETCKKHVSCEVKVIRFKKDDFTEVSANWRSAGSLTRINPDGVGINVDNEALNRRVEIRRQKWDIKRRELEAAQDAANSQLGLAFEFARPVPYTLDDEQVDAILKRNDIRCVSAPRVTGRSGQTVTMSFQVVSEADDEPSLQGTSFELTPTLIEGDRISLRTKFSTPSINKEPLGNDTSGLGKRVLEAMRIQNPNGRITKNAIPLAQFEQEVSNRIEDLLATYPDSKHHFQTSEALVGKTHVICLPTKVDGETGFLTVLVKCSVVDPPKGGTSATFDKPTADLNGFVNVGGAVKKPDRYELDKPTNVAQAIAAAGGIHGGSDPSTVFEVIILRQVDDVPGHIFSRFILDATKLGKAVTQADELWLKQKDIVFVKPVSPTITSEQAKELSKANHKQIVEVVPILGRTTAGKEHEISLDTDFLNELRAVLGTNGSDAFGSEPNSSVEIEKIAESKDEKRFIPLIGEAVHHHTYYKCTITFKDSDKRRELLIDHNHFHMD